MLCFAPMRPGLRLSVVLYDASGTFVEETVTNEQGFYLFGGLATGAAANYTVRVDTSTLPGTAPSSDWNNTVDPDNDLPEKMAGFAESLGLAEDPKWWFLAAGEEPTRGFLKDKLKFGQVTEEEVDALIAYVRRL